MSAWEFHPAAEQEVVEAAEWYEHARDRLGDGFMDAVIEAADRAAAFPERGSSHRAGTRRIVLDRFPYDVVYMVRPQRVVIVAVAHHSRRPGYWRKRLRTIH